MEQNSQTNRKYQDRNMQNLQRKQSENHNAKPIMYTTKATTHQTLSKT